MKLEVKPELTVQVDVTVRLSRRNLLSLVAKLDGYPVGSACTLEKREEDGSTIAVVAEPDEKHYKDRPEGPPGPVHPATRERLGELGEDPGEDPKYKAVFGV